VLGELYDSEARLQGQVKATLRRKLPSEEIPVGPTTVSLERFVSGKLDGEHSSGRDTTGTPEQSGGKVDNLSRGTHEDISVARSDTRKV